MSPLAAGIFMGTIAMLASLCPNWNVGGLVVPLITQMPCVTLPQRPAPFADDILGEEVVVLPEQRVCPSDYALIVWVHERLPVDAVLAINRWNPTFSSVFMPQQVVVAPSLEVSFIEEHDLFRTYDQFL
jgi:hypothetical protein